MNHDISRPGGKATSTRKGLEALLRDIGVEDPFDTGEEIGGRCPRHAERTGARENRIDHWSINARTGVHYCFSCGYSGNLRQLVEDLTKKSMWDALTMLREYGVELDPDAEPEIVVPNYADESSLDAFDADLPPEALAKRGLTPAAADLYGVRWSWTDRGWVFPARDASGALVGHQVKPTGGKDPRFAPGTRFSATLFGLFELRTARDRGDVANETPVLLVESARDVVFLRSLGFWGVAAWTSHVSQAQRELLREHLGGLVIVEALDSDRAGRSGAAALVEGWGGPEGSLTSFQYPLGAEGLDPGDLDADQIRSGIAAAAVVSTWTEPEPLPGQGFVPIWPPIYGGTWDQLVDAVAAETGTPTDLSGVVLLGMVSAAIGGAVQVNGGGGHLVPVNVYVAALAAPGEGKTPVLDWFKAVLAKIQAARREEAEPEITRHATEVRMLAAKAKQAEDAYAKPTAKQADRPDAVRRQEALDLAEELRELGPTPAMPRIFTTEATPEGLTRLASENGGRLAYITAEGLEAFEMTTRYSGKGAANHGMLLEGVDGKQHISDRAGRDELVIDRLTLTLVLLAQPVVLDHLGQDQLAAERGLYARFLWVKPRSLVGYRPTKPRLVPRELRAAYEARISELAEAAYEVQGAPNVLDLDDGAKVFYAAFRATHEARLRPDTGDLYPIIGWASKLPGVVLRLAGLIHALTTGSIEPGDIETDTMRSALTLAEYFSEHAMVCLQGMKEDPAVRDAALALDWVRDRGLTTVNRRDLYRSKKWRPERASAAFKVLEDFGWLRRSVGPRPSHRPAEVWDIHPGGSGAKGGQKSFPPDVSTPSGSRSADVVPIGPSAPRGSKKTPPAPRKFRRKVAP
jgi:replicative DNA helicase